MEIVFIRHGESESNKKGVYHGRLDSPLSDRGRKEALETSKLIRGVKFDKIYISPLKRAMQTAEILGFSGKKDERLCEINFGIFEGLSYSEILKKYPNEAKMWSDDFLNYRIPQGESLLDVYNRTSDFLSDILSEDGRILIVAHEGVIKCALSSVFEHPEYFFRFRVEYLRFSQICMQDGYKYIKSINSIQIY